jgi:hypothetical protein
MGSNKLHVLQGVRRYKGEDNSFLHLYSLQVVPFNN